MNAPPSLSVVVPVFNSAQTVERLVGRLVEVLGKIGTHLEIILVNDGSHDDSWLRIEEAATRWENVRGISLMRNYGQHNALLCGIRAASHELVVTMDDDFQHPPEEIPKLLASFDDGCDVVYGVPERARHNWLRKLASRLTKLVLETTMGVPEAVQVSSFRVFRTSLREAFAEYQSPFLSIDVLLSWGTTRFGGVVVRHDPRRGGPSTYSIRALVRHAFNMLTGYSALPLQLATLVGFTFTVLGIAVATFVLVNYFVRGGGVQGFTFLASIVAVFAGAQLFALGIIGEYLARVHFRVMDRPTYAIRSRTS